MEAVITDPQIAESAVRNLLQFIGEDPTRDGLVDTPARVAKAWREMTAGYKEDPASILSRVFDQECDQMVALTDIEFQSTCEHHMLPFYGTAVVGYLPGKVVGISKLARLVHCYAKRLQIQERLTQEIATAIQTHLQAQGVGVVIKSHHMCMSCRGVRQMGSLMVTQSLLGAFSSDRVLRAEFLRLA
jgi:GTP cyclohydrolase IA